MAIDMTKTRDAIRSVIDNYGTAITIDRYIHTKDKWGDWSKGTKTSVTTVGIPYNYFRDRFGFQPVGDMLEGEMKLIIRDDDVALPHVAGATDYRYELTYDSKTYRVIATETFIVAGIVLAKEVTMSVVQ
jgi:hypothetical protein